MQRPLPWFWILLALLLLLAPTPAARLLLDVLGGLTLTLLLLPLLLGAAGLLAWQLLQRRLRTCQVCGFTAIGLETCPACGTPFASGSAPGGVASGESGASGAPQEIPASDVTIDVEVIEAD